MSLVGDGRGLLGKGLVPTGGPPGTNLNQKIEKKITHSSYLIELLYNVLSFCFLTENWFVPLLHNTFPYYYLKELCVICMLWFNFILSWNFIFLCFKLSIIHYDTPQQKKIKFEPRIKLNHNMHNGLVCQFLSHAG